VHKYYFKRFILERKSEQGEGQKERERQRISSNLSEEPNMGLDPMTLRP